MFLMNTKACATLLTRNLLENCHLIRNDVLQPRDDKNESPKLIGQHDVIDAVDDLLQLGVVILQLLPSGDVPERIQDGNVEPQNQGHALIRT